MKKLALLSCSFLLLIGCNLTPALKTQNQNTNVNSAVNINRNNLNCVNEGGSVPVIPSAPSCCKGLSLINPKEPNLVGSAGICTAKCGNGICDEQTETPYNCPSDCCVKEGEQAKYLEYACCSGLKRIPNSYPDKAGHCISVGGSKFLHLDLSFCTKCGDGICGKGENKCNCPADCK